MCHHNLNKIKPANKYTIYLVAQKLARQSPERVKVEETA